MARIGVISVLIAVALTVGGCAALPETASPVADSERAQYRRELLQAQWHDVRHRYPEAIRPDVPVERTVTDREWPGVMVTCLKGLGFTVTAQDGAISFSSGSGQSSLDYAVALYACSAKYPTESAVVSRLNQTQTEFLKAYQANIVRPCLRLAGQPTASEPSTQNDPLAASGRNPYQRVWNSGLPDEVIRYLEARCPPMPPWLNLAGSDTQR